MSDNIAPFGRVLTIYDPEANNLSSVVVRTIPTYFTVLDDIRADGLELVCSEPIGAV